MKPCSAIAMYASKVMWCVATTKWKYKQVRIGSPLASHAKELPHYAQKSYENSFQSIIMLWYER